MIDVFESSDNYAAGKLNELMSKAIAQAYADGFNDGYKKCAEDYEIDLYDDMGFVDLGLPSGVLWSSKYREDGERNPLFLTYEEASMLDIPTEEQIGELIRNCSWDHIMGYVNRGGYAIKQPVGKTCIGTNGERISFDDKGLKFTKNSSSCGIYFWIRDDEEGEEKKAVYIDSSLPNGNPIVKIEKKEAGFRLPVMIVKKKKQVM